MKRILHYQITAYESNRSILRFLKEQGYTHNVITTLKKTPEGILRNQIWAHVNEVLCEGDLLTIRLLEPEFTTSIVPIEAPLSIVYEDEDILVIDKPAGMPIHPSLNHYENTLANAVYAYSLATGENYPFRCVNRLDRDTTGLTIVCKNLLAAGCMNAQILSHSLHRTYMAICEGNISSPQTVDAPIARTADSAVARCVDFVRGERAVTQITPLRYDATRDLSLIQLQLLTGRTHQIRVHMKYIGHPLIGDFLYNPNMAYIQRQALHSCTLDFVHPVKKEKMHFASSLPDDLKSIFPAI